MTKREIKRLRKSLKMSQQQFATELNVATSTVARWELGLSKPIPMAEEKLQELSKKISQEK